MALIVILVLVSLPVAAAMGLAIYGPEAFGWGLREYPKMTWLIICALIAAVLLAGLAYSHFFPQCHLLGFNSRIWICDKTNPPLRR